ARRRHRRAQDQLLRPRSRRERRRCADVARSVGRSAAIAADDPHRNRAEARSRVASADRLAPRSARGRLPRVGHGALALRRDLMRPTRTSRLTGPAPRRGQRGIALVLALWLTILLTVIASGFAFSMRGEALAARNAISLAQARAAADGAVERTLFELSRPRVADAWAADGTRRTWIENEIQFDVVAVDET